MIQRSILTGENPKIIIRAGGDVTVKGWEGNRLLADASDRWGLQIKRQGNAFEVHLGGSGQILVPSGSSVKVYAGKSAEIQEIRGEITAVAGANLFIREGNILAQACSGKAMEIDCTRVSGTELTITAGQDLRFRVREDHDIWYRIDDLGGKWETVFGSGRIQLTLKAGGNVTLVTGQDVKGQPPYYGIGQVERLKE